MTQSNVIAGALAVAFLIFITIKGELSDYIGLFTAKAEKKKSSGDDKSSIMGSIIPGSDSTSSIFDGFEIPGLSSGGSSSLDGETVKNVAFMAGKAYLTGSI